MFVEHGPSGSIDNFDTVPILQMRSLRLDKNKHMFGENSQNQKPGLADAKGNGTLHARQLWPRCS